LALDEFVSRIDANGTMTFLTDALRSAVALTGNTGTVQTSYTYEPFGTTTVTGTPTSNTLDYTGRENNPTGLRYYRARYYHPQLHRFIGEDPIGFAGGDVNLYAYVWNNPVRSGDPLGLDPHEDDGDEEEISEAGVPVRALARLGVRALARYGNVFPTKIGAGGKPQAYDPFTGRWMSAKQPPIADSPAWYFGAGVGQGFGGAVHGVATPTPATPAQAFGQTVGQIGGNVFNMLNMLLR
jgi:RHS repeat-associated protein